MKLSEYVLGLWRMDQWQKTAQESLSLFEQCLELGVDTFDQANVYGNAPSCEELFGDAIKLSPSLRARMKIISKFNICAHELPVGHSKHYNSSYQNMMESVDLSLSRMGVEYLDVLLVHRLDYLLDGDEVAKGFIDLKKQGKVLSFGVSNFSKSQFSLLQSCLDFPLVTNQLELNPLRFECLEDGTLDQCQQMKIRPMAWSPLAGGEIFSTTPTEQAVRVIKCLTELAVELHASIDQVCLAWVQRHPSHPHIVLGSGNLDRIKSAIKSRAITLTAEQWYRVWEASKGHPVP